MLDSLDVPGWLYYLLEEVLQLETAKLVTVLVRPRSRPPSDRSSTLFRVWAALDKRFRLARMDALQQRNCRALLTRQCSAPVRLVSGEGPLDAHDISELQASKLDLLLQFGGDALDSRLRNCARLGLWSLECSSSLKCEECELRKVPSAFREMCNGETVFRCGLSVIARTQEGEATLFRTAGITNFLSLAVNQNTAFWKVSDFLITQLSEPSRIRATGPAEEHPVTDAPPCPRAVAVRNTEMLRFLTHWSMRMLRHETEKRFYREQWFLAVRRRAETTKPGNACGFTIIRPPRNHFYADPFLFERNGRTYLFFEDYPFAISKGLISCCELNADGSPSEPRVVLEREYHLSYPFLFEYDGEVYMIPETQENHTIEMYRAREFPYSWVFHQTVMENVTAADTTLFHGNGKWWLFTAGILDRHSLNDTLCLFFADSPFGPWKAHPQNPVASDPRRARPAGSLFFENGNLFRPGQDCSNGYGYAVQMHRIDRLTETEYQETPLWRITPDWIPGNRGTHTLNQTGTYQVLDGRALISRFHIRWPFSALPRDSAKMSPAMPIGGNNSPR
jgi:hypothetical protein